METEGRLAASKFGSNGFDETVQKRLSGFIFYLVLQTVATNSLIDNCPPETAQHCPTGGMPTGHCVSGSPRNKENCAAFAGRSLVTKLQ
jgi:hypothetical protein